RELARRAQGWPIVRHVAREPLAPLGVAAASAACRLGGDRRHRVRPGRPPRADPLRIAGRLHSDLVSRRVHLDSPPRPVLRPGPAMEAAWARFGVRSLWALTAAAIVVDLLYFAGGVRWFGFVNYVFVWGAISLLGYAWLDDRFPSRRMLLVCAALALAVLLSLVLGGPYPVSMVGDPAEPVSNTTPPKVTLIALALVQVGALFAL